MQFKTLFFAAALTAQSVFAMSSSQQGQIKQNEKDVQSAQIHQLEDLAHTFQAQQSQMNGMLTIGAPPLNASAIVISTNAVSAILTAGAIVANNATPATLYQVLPVIINSLTNITNSVVSNAGPIITTPNIGNYGPVDQAAILTALDVLTDANTAFINAYVGPNGLVNNSLARGPIGVVLNLIERNIVNLAGALIARTPAFTQEAQTLLSQLHSSLALTISF
ncbi:hypothetical protein MKX08_006463 [Trichoderma sp. CBMAI-0020]|nr:hypothetical protein MKX08_006463 [Trichoderma sp. CBMAI-0020]